MNWHDAKMNWCEVRKFFMSWGVYPVGMNPHTPNGEMLMSYQCYAKMVIESDTIHPKLRSMIYKIIDAGEGGYFTNCKSWSEFVSAFHKTNGE